MTEHENGTVSLHTEPQQPQTQAQLQMQITPQGVMLQFPVNLGMNNEMTVQFIKTYLQAHPELVQEIAREALVQKQQEQQFLRLVKESRNE